MNLNGIWKVELLTMYEWEPRVGTTGHGFL
jgi:hypothetical protein